MRQACPRARVPPRPGPYARLLAHFHEHPQGRLHEILFWAGLGLLLGAVAYLAWRTGNLSTPLALMAGIVALCFVGFSLLPQRRTAPRAPGKGKRGEIAEKVRASKAEKKRKGPPPPGPPIRRG